MSRFFIERPIFAWVIAIVLMLAGVAAIRTLPISQYPSIAPTTISISAFYPGAAAEALEQSVTQVIEQKMKGLDGLQYMHSSSDTNGGVGISLTFAAGTDPDIAQVQVQNKLALATPSLPMEVQRQGIQVNKSSTSFLMVLGFVSDDPKAMTNIDLADYVATNVIDSLSRVEGVGNVQLFGSPYAMRIWLNPHKLANLALTPSDVAAAIQAQNAQVSAGQLGALPAVPGQRLNVTVTAQTRLKTKEEFDQILLRANPDGSKVVLADVARVELGGEGYEILARFNGKSATGCAVMLASGANALDTATAVKAKLAELETFFPPGMKAVVPYDTTPFVEVSIHEVIVTLAEAVGLVFLVMLLFLQSFRATLIPTIAVPVVLLGTFAVLSAFGFSINTLTLFGVVLAIGLLVDDAIVVVENVERIMRDEGLSPREATKKSMGQIQGALVGITLVLSAVFVPMAFFGGSTGVIYRQFSVTIVSAMVLSVIVAMVLTPALCATLLKPARAEAHTRGFSGWFNRTFARGTRTLARVVHHMIRGWYAYILMYGGIVAALVHFFLALPTSFLPDEDQGFLIAAAILPTGATQERTLAVVEDIEHHFLETEKANVRSIFAVAGFSFGGSGQNTAIGFVMLNDWDKRKTPDTQVGAIVGRAFGAFSQIRDAMVFAMAPPPLMELGNAAGFDLMLEDRAGLGHDALIAARNMLLGMASEDKRLVGVRPNGQEDEAQFRVDVDHAKAAALGVPLHEINATLSAAWGGWYINDFVDRGRVKRVFMRADAPFRMAPEDLNAWYARAANGQMTPFGVFATSHWTYGSPRLERYNGMPAVNLQGAAAPGTSSGDAMAAIEALAQKLPAGIGIEWSGLSFQERLSGSQAPMLYLLSLLVVFLCLAALYESWSIPFAVMLVVPLGVIGALLAAMLRDLSNDIYFQVGLLTTIGLSAKNAILIVEFAKTLVDQGTDVVAATLEAVRLRLRPILMTSLAFGLGVLPLALSTGAGSGSRNAVGTGVLGGMITATALGVLFVPLFFVMIHKVFTRRRRA